MTTVSPRSNAARRVEVRLTHLMTQLGLKPNAQATDPLIMEQEVQIRRA